VLLDHLLDPLLVRCLVRGWGLFYGFQQELAGVLWQDVIRMVVHRGRQAVRLGGFLERGVVDEEDGQWKAGRVAEVDGRGWRKMV
jgi:hypothetical protein